MATETTEPVEQVSEPKPVAPVQKKGFSEQKVFFAFAGLAIIVFGGMALFFVLKPGLAEPTGNVLVGTTADSSEAAAIVEGEKILLTDLEKRYATVPEELRAQISKSAVLESMIENTIILQEASKEGITASDAELEQALAGKEEQVKELLADGTVTREFLTNAVREYVIVNKYLEQSLFAAVTVSEEELNSFFEENKESTNQVRASHILVKTKEEADEILTRLGNDANFEQLAIEKSQDPGSGALGGDLGFFSRGQMVKPFEDTAFSMQPGDAPQIAESEFGFHVIKVTERKEGVFEDYKEQINDLLFQQKKDKAYTDFLAEQKAKKKIEILLKE
ncbi:MAG: peptidylprolyl isomerase [Candidatus Diapherotrites archaeon]|nr:peptidylprolyl isomerase [Candidatus Diapherotrites archaeon]